jgi:hypothetical protein
MNLSSSEIADQLRHESKVEPDVRMPGAGYIYVLAFASGRIKVGYSTNPRGRVGGQIAVARRIGVEAVGLWLSPLHVNASTNETALITWCRTATTARVGAEYFIGCAFSDVVEYAKSLEFRPAPESSPEFTPRPTPWIVPFDAIANCHGIPVAQLHLATRSHRLAHTRTGRTCGMTPAQIKGFLAERVYAVPPRRPMP